MSRADLLLRRREMAGVLGVPQRAGNKPTADNIRLGAPASTIFCPAQLTICCFVRPTAIGVNSGSISRNRGGGAGHLFFFDDATTLEGWVQTDSSLQQLALTVPNVLNDWHFVYMRVTSTDLDCSIDSATPATATLVDDVSSGIGLDLTLFSEPGGSAGHHLVAGIADYRFYDAALTNDELRSIRQSGGSRMVRYESLISWLPEPKVGTVDIVDPSRSWSEVGTGDSLTTVGVSFEERRVA